VSIGICWLGLDDLSSRHFLKKQIMTARIMTRATTPPIIALVIAVDESLSSFSGTIKPICCSLLVDGISTVEFTINFCSATFYWPVVYEFSTEVVDGEFWSTCEVWLLG